MKKTAVILAGGEGRRAGGGLPKQFRIVAGYPVLWWSIKKFMEEDPSTRIIVVVHPDYFDHWQGFLDTMPEAERICCEICSGGSSRWESVVNALGLIAAEEDSYIAVHDGARPVVDVEMIRRGWSAACVGGTAVPVVAMSDSLRHLSGEGSESVPRSDYVAVQTPQVFDSAILKKSYAKPYDSSFTDDASVVEASGYNVSLYEGSASNIKITNPFDFKIAEVIMADK